MTISKQQIPQVTPEDVERVVRREFSQEEYAPVTRILSDYGTEAWHRDKTRVQLAALKLAGGDVERLRASMESAKRDYRDVLRAAEYPAYGNLGLRGQDLPDEERPRVIDSDWQQYQAWLKAGV